MRDGVTNTTPFRINANAFRLFDKSHSFGAKSEIIFKHINDEHTALNSFVYLRKNCGKCNALNYDAGSYLYFSLSFNETTTLRRFFVITQVWSRFGRYSERKSSKGRVQEEMSVFVTDTTEFTLDHSLRRFPVGIFMRFFFLFWFSLSFIFNDESLQSQRDEIISINNAKFEDVLG